MPPAIKKVVEMDYYEILGVSKDSTDSDIKKAYRNLAKKYHPDTHPNDKECEEKFKDISKAYSVLSDEEKRKNYDTFGTEDGQQGFSNDSGFDSFFHNSFFGGFNPFGGMGGQTQQHTRGSDLNASISITFEESILGSEKRIHIKSNDVCKHCDGNGSENGKSIEVCPQCGGRGQVVYREQTQFGYSQTISVCDRCGGKGKSIKIKCHHCNGTGYEKSEKDIIVTIPKGIINGQYLRLRGKGNPSKDGGQNGDLILTVNVLKSNKYTRLADDIYSTIHISYYDAIVGKDITFDTVYGKLTRHIEKGTQSGDEILISGYGSPNLGYPSEKGDHHAKIQIDTPKNLTENQLNLLKSFNDSLQ